MRKLQFILIVSFALVIACGNKGVAASNNASTAAAASDSAICAVCGMKMPKKETVAFEHKGKKYHVCTNDEKIEFLKNPQKYLKKN